MEPENAADGFLLALLAAGVPALQLVRAEPVLRAGTLLLTTAFCQRVRRLLLVIPSRGVPPSPEQVAAYEDLRVRARARRALHAARLTESAVALASLRVFRNCPALLRRVLICLAARRGSLDPDIARRSPESAGGFRVRYVCTAHACRASELDIIDFLDHVHSLHM